jgi:hypothetical protein
MFDYLERTSLKFHIEEFIQTNIQLPYRIKNYYIDLSQNDGLLHIHIADLFLFNKHRPRPYKRTISFHIKDLNFEHLLNNVITPLQNSSKQENQKINNTH